MENTEKELLVQNNTEEKLTFFQVFIGIFLFSMYCVITFGIFYVIPDLLTIYISGWFGLLFIITFPLLLASWIAPFAIFGGQNQNGSV